MATDLLPEGDTTQYHAVVFGLYPGDPTFHTIVERAPEVGGAPGTAVIVAWLSPGVRHFIEHFRATASFSFYRFRHGGFGYNFGEPTAWLRARPVAWNGEIPNMPREALLDLDLALDDADGTVDIAVNGGRKVRSIEWASSTSAYPTEPTTAVNTDSEGDVTITDAFTLAVGETGYVTVQFFDQVSGGGNLLGTLRASVTRPTTGDADPETTLGTLVLNGDFEHDTDGAYWTSNAGSGTGSVSIETAAPLIGPQSLKLVSATDGSTLCFQSNSSSGFVTNSAAVRRLLPVEPGETFEVRATGKGQSDHPLRLNVTKLDEDLVQVAPEDTIATWNETALGVIVAYTVPATVRYIRWTWRVDTDTSARNYFADGLRSRRIDSTVTGIPTELSLGGIYYISEVEIVPDSSGGVEGSDPGYLYWGAALWRYIHPNGSKHFVNANAVTLVSLDGTIANTAEMMCYVGSNTARFTGLADTDMRQIVGVRKSRSAGWQYLGDSGWNAFTPNTNDGLVAEPVLTTEVV